MKRSFGTRLPLQFALCLGLYSFIGGFISFLGWAANIPKLTDWDGSGISIQPNTALTVIVADAGSCCCRAASVS